MLCLLVLLVLLGWLLGFLERGFWVERELNGIGVWCVHEDARSVT